MNLKINFEEKTIEIVEKCSVTEIINFMEVLTKAYPGDWALVEKPKNLGFKPYDDTWTTKLWEDRNPPNTGTPNTYPWDNIRYISPSTTPYHHGPTITSTSTTNKTFDEFLSDGGYFQTENRVTGEQNALINFHLKEWEKADKDGK